MYNHWGKNGEYTTGIKQVLVDRVLVSNIPAFKMCRNNVCSHILRKKKEEKSD